MSYLNYSILILLILTVYLALTVNAIDYKLNKFINMYTGDKPKFTNKEIDKAFKIAVENKLRGENNVK